MSYALNVPGVGYVENIPDSVSVENALRKIGGDSSKAELWIDGKRQAVPGMDLERIRLGVRKYELGEERRKTERQIARIEQAEALVEAAQKTVGHGIRRSGEMVGGVALDALALATGNETGYASKALQGGGQINPEDLSTVQYFLWSTAQMAPEIVSSFAGPAGPVAVAAIRGAESGTKDALTGAAMTAAGMKLAQVGSKAAASLMASGGKAGAGVRAIRDSVAKGAKGKEAANRLFEAAGSFVGGDLAMLALDAPRLAQMSKAEAGREVIAQLGAGLMFVGGDLAQRSKASGMEAQKAEEAARMRHMADQDIADHQAAVLGRSAESLQPFRGNLLPPPRVDRRRGLRGEPSDEGPSGRVYGTEQYQLPYTERRLLPNADFWRELPPPKETQEAIVALEEIAKDPEAVEEFGGLVKDELAEEAKLESEIADAMSDEEVLALSNTDIGAFSDRKTRVRLILRKEELQSQRGDAPESPAPEPAEPLPEEPAAISEPEPTVSDSPTVEEPVTAGGMTDSQIRAMAPADIKALKAKDPAVWREVFDRRKSLEDSESVSGFASRMQRLHFADPAAMRATQFLTEFSRRFLREGGYLTAEGARARTVSIGKLNSELLKAQSLHKNLRLAVQKSLGKGTSIVGRAQTVDFMRNKEFRDTVTEYMTLETSLPRAGGDKALAQQLARRGIEAKYGKEVADAVVEMRDHLDSLSSRLSNMGIKAYEDIGEVIEGNLNTYVRRRYRVFSDKKWYERAKNDPDLRADALAEVEHHFGDIAAKRAYKAAGTDVGPKFDKEYQAALENILEDFINRRRNLTPEQVNERLDLTGSRARSKILNAAPGIRRYMGEITDGIENYYNTVDYIAREMAQAELNTKLAGIFQAEGLSVGPDATPSELAALQAQGKTHELKGKEWGDLEGHTLSHEAYLGLRDYNKVIKEQHKMFRMLMAASAMTKASLTVFSPLSQARNFVAGISFAGIHGNWPTKETAKIAAAAWGQGGGKPNNQYFEEYRRLTEAGVLDSNIDARDLFETMHDTGWDPTKYDPDANAAKSKQAGKWFLRGWSKAYAMGDNFWKMNAHLNERRKLKEAYGDTKTDAEIFDEASSIVRDTIPNYDRLPVGLQQLRRMPFVAPFISWHYEMFATIFRGMARARMEVKSGNPKLQAIGRRRMIGYAASAAIPSVLSAASAAMFGYDEKDKRAFRSLMPSWDENSTFFYLPGGENKVRAVSLSYLDAYAGAKAPIQALFRVMREDEATAGQAAMEFLQPFVDPFISKDVFTGLAMEALANKTGEGYQVHNEELPWADRMLAKVEHVWNGAKPGAFKLLSDWSENQGEAASDMALALMGMRMAEIDFEKSAFYGARRFQKDQREANAIFTSAARKTNDPRELTTAYQQSERARWRRWSEMRRQYEALLQLGVPPRQVQNKMKEGGMSQKTLDSLRTNRFQPYEPTESWLKSLEPVKRRAVEQMLRQR